MHDWVIKTTNQTDDNIISSFEKLTVILQTREPITKAIESWNDWKWNTKTAILLLHGRKIELRLYCDQYKLDSAS